MTWQQHLLETDAHISELLERVRTVAVLGIKVAESGAPAFYVPEYAQHAGLKIYPVPVYYPDVTEILGERVYRRVQDVPQPLDLVNVFRRSEDVPKHLDDILAAKPSAVWMQLGIRNDEVAKELAQAGIDIVQDHCLLVELRNRGR